MAKDPMYRKIEYERVIFCDEKKFSLDSHDGCLVIFTSSTWCQKYLQNSLKGIGSLMILSEFSFGGKVNAVLLSGRKNALSYLMISSYLLLIN